MKSKKIPAFFKPFIAEVMKKRMLIPPYFSKFMEGRMPSSAKIRDRTENLWHVEVSQRGDEYYIEDGWSKFVQEKNVQMGDCLVFEYDGESIFDVKLFGITACEKEFTVEVLKLQVKEEEMEDEESEDTEIHEDEEDEDSENEEMEDDDDDYDYNDDDVVEIVELTDANKRKKRKKKDTSCRGGMGNSRKSEDLDDEEIFDSGIVDRPKNPYFVAKLHPKRKSDLRVPTDVIKHFKLKLPKLIDICDDNKKTWSAVVKEWRDGRTCITKGWRAFWKWNAVKTDDRCLCEFVPGNGGSEIRLQIHIVRAKLLLQ